MSEFRWADGASEREDQFAVFLPWPLPLSLITMTAQRVSTLWLSSGGARGERPRTEECTAPRPSRKRGRERREKPPKKSEKSQHSSKAIFSTSMPSLSLKKKAPASSAAAAASPSELAELLLADPVANANLLPKLLALEAVPSDDVSELF